MLANWDPFAEISRLQTDLFKAREPGGASFRPSVDIYEDEDGVHIRADVAGVKKEDIKLEIDKNVLTLRGERRLDQVDKKKGYHRVERSYGSFARSFSLGQDVNTEDVQANYEDGVLTVLLPRVANAEKREIAVG